MTIRVFTDSTERSPSWRLQLQLGMIKRIKRNPNPANGFPARPPGPLETDVDPADFPSSPLRSPQSPLTNSAFIDQPIAMGGGSAPPTPLDDWVFVDRGAAAPADDDRDVAGHDAAASDQGPASPASPPGATEACDDEGLPAPGATSALARAADDDCDDVFDGRQADVEGHITDEPTAASPSSASSAADTTDTDTTDTTEKDDATTATSDGSATTSSPPTGAPHGSPRGRRLAAGNASAPSGAVRVLCAVGMACAVLLVQVALFRMAVSTHQLQVGRMARGL